MDHRYVLKLVRTSLKYRVLGTMYFQNIGSSCVVVKLLAKALYKAKTFMIDQISNHAKLFHI